MNPVCLYEVDDDDFSVGGDSSSDESDSNSETVSLGNSDDSPKDVGIGSLKS